MLEHTPADCTAFQDSHSALPGPWLAQLQTLLYSWMPVGTHPADPISLPKTEESYLNAVNNPRRPTKVAFSPDLGVTPVDKELPIFVERRLRYSKTWDA